MKIERLSENQIRCTLNKEDLKEKHLKISELAYGSQKARELFRDMIQQASAELGFEIDDTPLMVEAIPLPPESLVLIVTKVDDPEELDTRFSRFSKSTEYDIDDDDIYDGDYDNDDDFDDDEDDDFVYDMPSNPALNSEDSHDNDNDQGNTSITRIQISGSGNVPEEIKNALEDVFKNLSDRIGITPGSTGSTTASAPSLKTAKQEDHAHEDSDNTPEEFQMLYIFDSLSTVIKATKNIAAFYFSRNCLYKDPSTDRFYLIVSNSNNSHSEFVRACDILSEYGTMETISYARPAYFKEHFISILPEDAVQTLSAL